MKKLDLWVEKVPFGDHIATKISHIVLQGYSTGPQGELRISADCRTAGEVVWYANYLITELEAIKRKAKRLLP